MLILYITAIFFLLCLSAISSASETAFTASSLGKMQKLKSEGNKNASIIMDLFKFKERVISSLLITNSLVNTISTSLITTVFLKSFGDSGLIYSTIVMAVLIIVFGEVLPKHLAVLSPEKWALFLANILNIIVIILTPVNIILDLIVKLVIRVFKLHPKTNTLSVEDEVKGILDYQHEAGNVVKNDKDMLGGVLDLKQIRVEEIMLHRKDIFTINYDLPLSEIIKISLSQPYTRIPLWSREKDNVIGILHIKDLLKEIERNGYDLNKARRENFVREPWFIVENISVSDQLHAFRSKRKHFALVVNEYGDLQGLVTLEDILEEIVGNIEDEHDISTERIILTKNGYVIDGAINVRDLNRQLGWKLPETASTIAGLLIHEVKRMPEEGESFELFDFKIQVLKKSNNMLQSIRFAPMNHEDDSK
jgi:Mg2+/Co2+ transporter CorB